ncbi:MAG: ChbG/HpnK family deacetylase [Anaeromyxobacteraceae bacterium]
MPGPATLLLVNADDLGYDPEIDRGILEAHARGIVTAATAMVDTPYAARALAAAPATLDLGLHAVLEGGLAGAALEADLERQLARFTALRGSAPTHLDSHRHAHAHPDAEPIFARVAARHRLPLRAIDGGMRARLRAAGVRTADAFLGDAAVFPFWTRARLSAALAALPPGAVELMCHPGYAPSAARTRFGAEREVELDALVDPAALDAAGPLLATFAELAVPD